MAERPAQGVGQVIKRQIWRARFEIPVERPWLKTDQLQLFAAAGLVAGSGLCTPWLREMVQGKRRERAVALTSSGAIAQDDSVAAGAGGVAVGGDVRGPVIIAGEGAHVTVTSKDDDAESDEPEGS